ncbi:MAG: penicillin-binding transpeptidase domain-containing protein [Clostridia bacterium]|nr:penicillin-binding transpeptidase domain-containing protein [Clostridia bacterium]
MRKKSKIIKIDNLGQKKLRICISVGFIMLLLLIIRIGFLQFVQGAELKKMAVKNQLTSKTITPSRGTIYDSTGKALAISAKVDTVSVNPSDLKNSDGTDINKEFLAHAFSDIFELDYSETLEKLNTKTSTFIIASKVENDKITALQTWMKNNSIDDGISINEDIKRYYPYDNLAANLIGFTGFENSGLAGLELTLNDMLSGTPGKILTSTDSVNGEIPNGEQSYMAVQNGNDITLTIDVNVQSIAEKYLAQAVTDNKADGGNVIIMNPSNGDVLAMSTYPNYNLNEPYTINTNELKEKWNNLSSKEKNNELFNMWNNSAVQSTYEPGSTFKIITAATALEEGIIAANTPNAFYCTGSEPVAGINIDCWKYYDPHGAQTLKEALANSCNPAFIQLGRKIGAKTLYKYYKGFGLFDKTNSYFYGESNSVFFNENNINEYNLATMSFGQRFTITPIQLITAVSAIANEGVLMKPRIVKELKNTDTGSITTIEPNKIRQVISKKTSETMMEMLEYVVTNGTGKYANIAGYSIGGKSGTSEPLSGNEDEGYVASFIGLSPTINTQVVVLVTIYHPKGDSHQGGQVAGPVVKQILSEVLPYLGIASTNTPITTSSSTSSILPDVRNKTIEEAKALLKASGFKVNISGNEDESTTLVTDQVPKPGVTLLEDSTIYLYTSNNNERSITTVPILKGMSSSQVINSIKASNLNVIIDGSRNSYKSRYCIWKRCRSWNSSYSKSSTRTFRWILKMLHFILII